MLSLTTASVGVAAADVAVVVMVVLKVIVTADEVISILAFAVGRKP